MNGFSEQQYKYDAFISYRHTEPDRTIAVKLQEMLEKYKVPKELAARIGDKKLHFFRDEDELPTSSNLSAGIDEALVQSRYLICICSPAYLESRWCMQEINQFKAMHGGSNANIIPLVVAGDDPTLVFPEQLTHETRYFTDATGAQRSHEVEIEPLAGNVAAPTVKESLKKLKTEALRIAAPLLGVGFNDLYDRDTRRAVRRRRTITVVAFASMALFLAYSSVMLIRIANQNKALKYRNAEVLTSEAQAALAADNRLLAAKSGVEAAKLYESLGEDVPGELVSVLADASFVYNFDRSEAGYLHRSLPLTAPAGGMAYFEDGETLLVYDTMNTFYVIDVVTNAILYRESLGTEILDAHTDGMKACLLTQEMVLCFDAERMEEAWRFETQTKNRERQNLFLQMANAAGSPVTVVTGITRATGYGSCWILDKKSGKVLAEKNIRPSDYQHEIRMAMHKDGTCAFTFSNKTEGTTYLGRLSPDGQYKVMDTKFGGTVTGLCLSDAGIHFSVCGGVDGVPKLVIASCKEDFSKELWVEELSLQSFVISTAGMWSGTFSYYGEMLVTWADNQIFFQDVKKGTLSAYYYLPEAVTGVLEQEEDSVFVYGQNGIYRLKPEKTDTTVTELVEEIATVRFDTTVNVSAKSGDSFVAGHSTEAKINSYLTVSSDNVQCIKAQNAQTETVWQNTLVIADAQGKTGAAIGWEAGASGITVLSFDVKTNQTIGKTRIPDCVMHGCTFTDKGHILIVYYEISDPEKPAVAVLLDTDCSELQTVLFDGGFQYIDAEEQFLGYNRYPVTSGGYIALAPGMLLWDDGGKIGYRELEESINCFACNENGHYVYVSPGTTSNDFRQTVFYGTDPVRGKDLQTVTENGKALTIPAENTWVNSLPDVAISEDGGRIAFIDLYNNRICVAETEGKNAGEVQEIPFYGEDYTPQKLHFSSDGTKLYAVTANGYLLKYDAEGGKLLAEANLGVRPHANYRVQGERVFSEFPDGTLLIWLSSKTVQVNPENMEVYGSFVNHCGCLPQERILYGFDGSSPVACKVMDPGTIVKAAEVLLETFPDGDENE